MSVVAKITRDVISANNQDYLHEEIGARIVFEGIVRSQEGERIIDGLDYEAYEGMALKKLQTIGEQLLEKHKVESLAVIHRIGFVPVGEVSLLLVIQSRHRKEAFVCCDEFINELKKDVPIWKAVGENE